MDNIKLIGSPCGQHGPYTFYKAFRYNKSGQTRILAISDFCFVRLWSDSALISIGELQLLWIDKSSEQTLASLRLYFLPENTPDGRNQHGEDEVLAISEKVVLRVEDLVTWIAVDCVDWRWGLPAVWQGDCSPAINGGAPQSLAKQGALSQSRLDFVDIEKERKQLEYNSSGPAVVVLSFSRYCRYRAMVKRLEGVADRWLRDSLVAALGGFAAPYKNTRILFCKETFDYPDLETHELLCNHLAPKLKGRPRGRRKKRSISPGGSESNESESSLSTNAEAVVKKTRLSSTGGRNGLRCNAAASPRRRTTSNSAKTAVNVSSKSSSKLKEQEFMEKVNKFMKQQKTPISRRLPSLGHKELDLFIFYSTVQRLGGYDVVTASRQWKTIFQEVGGNHGSTSAATITRRHYEKLLLAFERSEQKNKKDNASRDPLALDHDQSKSNKTKASKTTNNNSENNKKQTHITTNKNKTNNLVNKTKHLNNSAANKNTNVSKSNCDSVKRDSRGDKVKKEVKDKVKNEIKASVIEKSIVKDSKMKKGLEDDNKNVEIKDIVISDKDIVNVETKNSDNKSETNVTSNFTSAEVGNDNKDEAKTPLQKNAVIPSGKMTPTRSESKTSSLRSVRVKTDRKSKLLQSPVQTAVSPITALEKMETVSTNSDTSPRLQTPKPATTPTAEESVMSNDKNNAISSASDGGLENISALTNVKSSTPIDNDADSDNDIIEVPYRPQTPEIINLDDDSNPPPKPEPVQTENNTFQNKFKSSFDTTQNNVNSSYSFKKRKLAMLQQIGLEVTPVSDMPELQLISESITRVPNPNLFKSTDKVSITVTPELNNILPMNPPLQRNIIGVPEINHKSMYAGTSPYSNQMPKLIQNRTPYAAERIVYGNPKDIMMQPPHVLQNIPRYLNKKASPPKQMNQTCNDVLDLTVKAPQKPVVEIMRVPNIANPITKPTNVYNNMMDGRSNLEITLVGPRNQRNFVNNKAAHQHANVPPKLAHKRNSNGKAMLKDFYNPKSDSSKPYIAPKMDNVMSKSYITPSGIQTSIPRSKPNSNVSNSIVIPSFPRASASPRDHQGHSVSISLEKPRGGNNMIPSKTLMNPPLPPYSHHSSQSISPSMKPNMNSLSNTTSSGSYSLPTQHISTTSHSQITPPTLLPGNPFLLPNFNLNKVMQTPMPSYLSLLNDPMYLNNFYNPSSPFMPGGAASVPTGAAGAYPLPNQDAIQIYKELIGGRMRLDERNSNLNTITPTSKN